MCVFYTWSHVSVIQRAVCHTECDACIVFPGWYYVEKLHRLDEMPSERNDRATLVSFGSVHLVGASHAQIRLAVWSDRNGRVTEI